MYLQHLFWKYVKWWIVKLLMQLSDYLILFHLIFRLQLLGRHIPLGNIWSSNWPEWSNKKAGDGRNQHCVQIILKEYFQEQWINVFVWKHQGIVTGNCILQPIWCRRKYVKYIFRRVISLSWVLTNLLILPKWMETSML